ncbi:hypothetical protein ACIBH1_01235 [Nonomuraea sp. NPDC050663]|uniref:hypothetical protein n=1 Tax=Nonomuraea sp. NPDC050663 TaxID=3364370 RepID=UPI0037A45524
MDASQPADAPFAQGPHSGPQPLAPPDGGPQPTDALNAAHGGDSGTQHIHPAFPPHERHNEPQPIDAPYTSHGGNSGPQPIDPPYASHGGDSGPQSSSPAYPSQDRRSGPQPIGSPFAPPGGPEVSSPNGFGGSYLVQPPPFGGSGHDILDFDQPEHEANTTVDWRNLPFDVRADQPRAESPASAAEREEPAVPPIAQTPGPQADQHDPLTAPRADQHDPLAAPRADLPDAGQAFPGDHPLNTPGAFPMNGERSEAAQEDLPALPAFPGAYPWELTEKDAGPYDWFVDPEPGEHPVPPSSGQPETQPGSAHPELPPVVPGAPPWQPPPGFTAAAAGMRVWPAPVSDSPSMPPWPAATGEPVADDAAPYDAATFDAATFDAAPLDAAIRDVPAYDAPAYDATIDDPASATVTPTDAQRDTQLHGQPSTQPQAQQDTQPHALPDTQPHAQPDTQPNPHVGPQLGTQWTEARHDAPPSPDADTPILEGTPVDPSVTIAVPRPAEPSDVPVWPPMPHQTPAPLPAPEQTAPEPVGEHPQEHEQPPPNLPELPFGPEVWGPKAENAPTPPQGFQLPEPSYAQWAPAEPPPPVVETPAAGGKGKKVAFAALGVLVVAGVATGGVLVYRTMNTSNEAAGAVATAPVPSATQQAPSEQPTTDETTTILNSEETDPKTLALSEAFPDKKIKIGKTVYTRVKAEVAEDCSKAASGPFADALRDQQCSRVLRATYVDAKRKYAVTTGLAVLPTKDAAMQADQAKNLGRNLWFRALPGPSGSGADRVHIAGGYAAGLVWGRYIVFSYATYADGHTPEAKEKGLGTISGAFRDHTSTVLERRVSTG